MASIKDRWGRTLSAREVKMLKRIAAKQSYRFISRPNPGTAQRKRRKMERQTGRKKRGWHK